MCGPGNDFNPLGDSYDYATARRAGMRPSVGEDGLPHWPSRAPLSPQEATRLALPPDSGVILKGAAHPTFDKAIEADRSLGYEIMKIGNRYYSVKE